MTSSDHAWFKKFSTRRDFRRIDAALKKAGTSFSADLDALCAAELVVVLMGNEIPEIPAPLRQWAYQHKGKLKTHTIVHAQTFSQECSPEIRKSHSERFVKVTGIFTGTERAQSSEDNSSHKKTDIISHKVPTIKSLPETKEIQESYSFIPKDGEEMVRLSPRATLLYRGARTLLPLHVTYNPKTPPALQRFKELQIIFDSRHSLESLLEYIAPIQDASYRIMCTLITRDKKALALLKEILLQTQWLKKLKLSVPDVLSQETLESIPKDLTTLIIDGSSGLESLEFLKDFTALKFLALPPDTNDLHALARITTLKKIEISGMLPDGHTAERLSEHIESLHISRSSSSMTSSCIEKFNNLTTLTLSDIRGNLDYTFLYSLQKLTHLTIFGCQSTVEIPPLFAMNSLKFLALKYIGNMSSLYGIENLQHIETLILAGMPKIKEFPDFSNLFRLHNVYIEMMHGLESYSSLGTIPFLKNLVLGFTGKKYVAGSFNFLSEINSLEGFEMNYAYNESITHAINSRLGLPTPDPGIWLVQEEYD